jgi:hypothetical protein
VGKNMADDASVFLKQMLPPPPRPNSSKMVIKLKASVPEAHTETTETKTTDGSPSAFSEQQKTKKEECADDRSSVAWDYDADPLPLGWKKVPSASRPVRVVSYFATRCVCTH